MADTPQTVVLKLRGRDADAELPSLLSGATRAAGDNEPDPFLPPNYLRQVAGYEVGVARRGEDTPPDQVLRAAPEGVMVLELADGGVLVTSAARLRASLERSQPGLVGDDGSIDLDRLGAGAATSSRSVAGTLGALVSRVFSVVAGEERDDIVDQALEAVTDPLLLGASWVGTKALMAVIERKVEKRVGREGGGLFEWDGRERFEARPPKPKAPMLVFVHGTASSTQGSFGDLRETDPGLWTRLERSFTGGIWGFEHRTLSESPIDNALKLVELLPAEADICLVTHSRGGLVGDLLCLDADDPALPAAIETYAYRLPHTGEPDPARDQLVRDELGKAHAEHRAALAKLRQALADKRITVRRYVRVASPARGTLLAGANFDLFLSGLLTLLGQIPPLRASVLYSAFKRVVIEIAKRRTDPHLVPGIEAMLPDSPLALLLRRAKVRPTEMALIAGDIEGGGLFKRLGVFLTDTLIFEREDNDLVVDTQAMLAGIAPAAQAKLLFDQGDAVSHFRYFVNPRTRSALGQWLLDGPTGSVFTPLPAPGQSPVYLPPVQRSLESDTRPIVVVLPGIMGSNLKVNGVDRVWFDPIDLFGGGLARIRWGTKDVETDGLFDSFYGDLCRFLQRSHRVEVFPYDWRLSLEQLGQQLLARLAELAKAAPDRPIRLLAHSMGGLVVRSAFHQQQAGFMNDLMARKGARLVMCGTPHQGSHSMVENLIGKGDMLRKLVVLDTRHDLQQVLDLVAGFRGALQLLPKPGFVDTFQGQDDGGEFFDYQAPATWRDFRGQVADFWFGDGRVGQPLPEALAEGSWLWGKDGAGRPQLPLQHAGKTIYVAGVASHTPCGVRRDARGRLKMVATSRGDGTVTWASGRIDGIGSFYYMPRTEHGSLLSNDDHFVSLEELLSEGRTSRLETTAPAVRAAEGEAPVLYDAAPPTVDEPLALARVALGAGLAERLPPAARQPLEVGVSAMDLRFTDMPILVGHYQDDPIAGPEALINSELLGGALSERDELGLYAGPLGTALAVLQEPGPSGQRRGAVVTGLGPYDGTLTSSRLTEAVRAGALRYLLHTNDVLGPQAEVPTLGVLLLGYNSSTHISVHASVDALVRGVIEANARFQQSTQRPRGITRIEIIELFRDTAISACYSLRRQYAALSEYAALQGCDLKIRPELLQGDGVRQRLQDRAGSNYWPRFIVSGEFSEPDVGKRRSRFADELRFLHVGERARAEAVAQQRQPGQIEALVKSQIHTRRYQPDFGRALFQLTVPHEFKESIRGVSQAVFVVDETTANLPWELMLADDPQRGKEQAKPLSVRTRLVRQFQTGAFRRNVRQSVGHTALVIANPSTEGFATWFPAPSGKPARTDPVDLPAAEKEGVAVADQLLRLGYEVERCIGNDQTHGNVVVRLQRRPWRILHVSAHGVFGEMHADGRARTGVLLSDGFLLTAVEIRALEVVPELVFLNCCHLGTMDTVGSNANLLAASVARELIEVGVRCVVVAGWAVTDTVAQVFGERFYEELLQQGRSFGDAAHEARRAAWNQDPSDITWGAFQVYGDPDWRAERQTDGGARDDGPFAAPEEVLDALARLRVEFTRRVATMSAPQKQREIARVHRVMAERCPADWRGLAEVQSALGATWQALNQFDDARNAYLAALQAAGREQLAYTHDIERLANVETKLAERTKKIALADLAIQRLEQLGSAVRTDPEVDVPSTERQGLLGSAWKVRALLLAGAAGDPPLSKAQLAAVNAALEASARSYRAVTLPATDPRFDGYPALNWLWLEVVRGRWTNDERTAAAKETDTMAEALRVQAGRTGADAWKKIMAVEVHLVAALVKHAFDDKALKRLAGLYADFFRRELLKPFERDAALDQMNRMAHLMRQVAPGHKGTLRADAGQVAGRLERLAADLRGTGG